MNVAFNIPGLYGSAPNHWQSHWERRRPGLIRRVQQKDFDHPDMEEWTQRIQDMTQGINSEKIVLIGHSVGCAAIVHWFQRFNRKLAGAVLVAPSDVDDPNYPSYITGFSPMPTQLLPFTSIVIASSTDHVVTAERAFKMSVDWGSDFKLIEDAGHFVPGDGYGKWEEGLTIIDHLLNS